MQKCRESTHQLIIQKCFLRSRTELMTKKVIFHKTIDKHSKKASTHFHFLPQRFNHYCLHNPLKSYVCFQNINYKFIQTSLGILISHSTITHSTYLSNHLKVQDGSGLRISGFHGPETCNDGRDCSHPGHGMTNVAGVL